MLRPFNWSVFLGFRFGVLSMVSANSVYRGSFIGSQRFGSLDEALLGDHQFLRFGTEIRGKLLTFGHTLSYLQTRVSQYHGSLLFVS